MAEPGKAPASLEPSRRPNMKETVRLGKQGGVRPGLEVPLDLPAVPESRVEVNPPTQMEEPTVASCLTPRADPLPSQPPQEALAGLLKKP